MVLPEYASRQQPPVPDRDNPGGPSALLAFAWYHDCCILGDGGTWTIAPSGSNSGFYDRVAYLRNPDGGSQPRLAWNPEVFWTKQLELNPGSPIGWGHMGDTFKKLGKTDRAEEAYRKAIALRDVQGLFYPEAHTKVAKIMISRGDSAGAEAEYRLVVEKRPEHYVALLNLGELLLHDRSTVNEAIPLLKRAAEVKAKDFRPYANLSQAYRIAGEFDNSLKAIESAIQLRPDIPTLRQVKAEILSGGN